MKKLISTANLYRDLGYILMGNFVADTLLKLCPVRRDMTVIELGSGSGKLGIAYALGGATVQLVDIDENALKCSSMLADAVKALTSINPYDPGPNVILTHADLFKEFYLITSKGFDLCFNEGVPQHWPRGDERRQGCIDRMAGLTKSGGMVIVIGANGENIMEQARDGEKFTYEGMPEKRDSFVPGELLDALEKAGLKDIRLYNLHHQNPHLVEIKLNAPFQEISRSQALYLIGTGVKP